MSPAQRKTVTVVFCDLAGSTALGESVDPERLRVLLARYFETMKQIVESHGGAVEKFIGDAVMAVFGVPLVHEDDALRAVRAASEMRDALPELELKGRIGVITGEVVTGTEERLVTGDPVNVAARLEQRAEPGEILIGEPTYVLVRDAVEVEAIEPLTLKGKSEPVTAFRLLRVLDAPERRHDTPFVGRRREIALVREAWERVVAEQRCELVTIVGDAGVGKSRLVAEALESLDARVVHGRCPPYGDGVTYWPVVEVVKNLGTVPPNEEAAEALRSLLGESDVPTSADEIAWAVRKTFEHATADQPLVVVFDDIQWGEETFHDLVEHLVLLSTGAPILVLCVARPELADTRPTWPVALRLEPLPPEAVEELIPRDLPPTLRDRLLRSAGGNPLFIGEMLALSDNDDDQLVVPPTLRALLAARLDQLEPMERAVLEQGAVEGEIFHRGAVNAMAGPEGHVTACLARLVRKGLIRPEQTRIPDDDAYRFRHLLLRDAAYDAIAKTVRAEYHRSLAEWLDLGAGDLVERDELIGFHFEQAHACRVDLGLAWDPGLAGAARKRLTDAGLRAAHRQDYRAAASLFERAAALCAPLEPDLLLEAELGEVYAWLGDDDRARSRAAALVDVGSASGDRVVELTGRILDGVRAIQGDEERAAALERLLEPAQDEREFSHADIALYVRYSATAELAVARARHDAALAAFERALAHADDAGYQPSSSLAMLAYCRFAGTTPVTELLVWLDELEPGAGRNQFVRAYRAWSLARLGKFDDARAILTQACTEQADRGGGLLLANLTAFESVAVEVLAGDFERAATFGREGCRLHEELGASSYLVDAAGELARVLVVLDQLEDAERYADRAAAVASIDTGDFAWSWRCATATLLARRGACAEAERLAQEAVAITAASDSLDSQGQTLFDLAGVLLLTGKPYQARAALSDAHERFDRKGNIVMAHRVRERMNDLHEAVPE